MLARIAQKWLRVCYECGCVFSLRAAKQKNKCPACGSQACDQIEGFKNE